VKKIQKFPKTDTDNVVYSGSTMTTVVDKIATEFDKIEAEKAEMENRKPRTFQVIDYTLGVKDLISKLVPEEWSLISDEERLEIVTAF
jgi:hypothetical protein